MMLVVITSILSLIVFVYTLRNYLLFKFGLEVKGKVVDVKYEVIGIKTRVPTAKITYNYIVKGKLYERTENSEAKKHMFKMHCMEGETIKVYVHKKDMSKATIVNLKHYFFPVALTAFLFLISVIAVVVSI
ncbi:hypothetical protein [Tenacibaculum sp.]|uniref:hypothetical protein n=1 Tax=Tenacibaculum sp. TaxID=1906242 RepID=UPI003AA8D3C7